MIKNGPKSTKKVEKIFDKKLPYFLGKSPTQLPTIKIDFERKFKKKVKIIDFFLFLTIFKKFSKNSFYMHFSMILQKKVEKIYIYF